MCFFSNSSIENIPDNADLSSYLIGVNKDINLTLQGSNYCIFTIFKIYTIFESTLISKAISQPTALNVKVQIVADAGVTPIVYCAQNSGLSVTGNRSIILY